MEVQAGTNSSLSQSELTAAPRTPLYAVLNITVN